MTEVWQVVDLTHPPDVSPNPKGKPLAQTFIDSAAIHFLERHVVPPAEP